MEQKITKLLHGALNDLSMGTDQHDRKAQQKIEMSLSILKGHEEGLKYN